jgi:lysosomal alpha-mannosidase
MDKIIKYINARPDVYNMKLVYSTPSIYLDAVHSADIEWELNQYDFFP